MYKLIPLLFLVACGGDYVETCEDQGLFTKTYVIKDNDENIFYEQCETQKECQVILCKQGPCPVCLKDE